MLQYDYLCFICKKKNDLKDLIFFSNLVVKYVFQICIYMLLIVIIVFINPRYTELMKYVYVYSYKKKLIIFRFKKHWICKFCKKKKKNSMCIFHSIVCLFVIKLKTSYYLILSWNVLDIHNILLFLIKSWKQLLYVLL